MVHTMHIFLQFLVVDLSKITTRIASTTTVQATHSRTSKTNSETNAHASQEAEVTKSAPLSLGLSSLVVHRWPVLELLGSSHEQEMNTPLSVLVALITLYTCTCAQISINRYIYIARARAHTHTHTRTHTHT